VPGRAGQDLLWCKRKRAEHFTYVRRCVSGPFFLSGALASLFPRLAIPHLPFMAAYGLAVAALAGVEACLRAGDLAFERRDGCVMAPFPGELGVGCWAFVEHPCALPWR
jgi:hypothetical protein